MTGEEENGSLAFLLLPLLRLVCLLNDDESQHRGRSFGAAYIPALTILRRSWGEERSVAHLTPS